MKKLVYFILGLIRLFVLFRVLFLLYKTSVDPENYPITLLSWWIYYLVFDIWIFITFKSPPNLEED